MPNVTLRYFPALGRAQPLRDVLLEAASLDPQLRFEDLQLPLAEWRDHKQQPAFAGEFQSLPTLSWGDVTLAETLPIAGFLARQLGFYEGLSPLEIARVEAIISCCYVDVTIMVGIAIWAEMLCPGTTVEASAERIVPRLLAKLARLEARLPESGWLGASRPNVADFFLFEAYESVALLLGPQRGDALRLRLPRLAAFVERIWARPALAANMRRPVRFSGTGDEPAMLERIWQAPLGVI
jgi:glutathione S-transferase